MEPWISAKVKEMADEARNRVKGGRLFGEPIDMSNPDMVIAAVMAMVSNDEQQKAYKEQMRIFDLLRKGDYVDT